MWDVTLPCLLVWHRDMWPIDAFLCDTSLCDIEISYCVISLDRTFRKNNIIDPTAAYIANNGFGPIPWKNDYQNYSYLNS
jgi:hypothetical protein